MTRARIIGVGAYAPKRILTNEELERMVETSDEWIVQRTGIRERRIADESEATSDLALKAAQQALERAGVEPGEIDLIVVGTTTGDMAFPTTANIVQHQLGCRNAGSMDLYAACSGSIYSLSVGSQYIESGKYRTVLCIGAECLSRITDFTDRGTCILLADAAGAAVLRPATDESGIIDTDLYSDGRYGELLIQPAGGSLRPATHETVDQRQHFARMKGNEVFKVAVRMFGEWAEADAALGFRLSRLCFEGPAEELALTANTQPAVLTASVAAAAALAERGVTPDLAAGHSLGEYSALVVGGALSFAEAVRLVRRRGEVMQEAVPVGTGAMAA